MIENYIYKKIFDELYAAIREKVAEKKCSLSGSKKNLEKALMFHTTSIRNWSKDISLDENIDEKPTLNTYIPLEYFVIPRSLEIAQYESKEKIRLNDILGYEKNIILIGQPGAGKTTTMQYIAQSFFYKNEFLTNFDYLIVLRLRDLNRQPDASLITALLDSLGIFINYKGESNREIIEDINKHVLLEALEKLSPIILFDGFDEIFDSNSKQNIVYELDWLSLASDRHKFILTSRIGDLPRGLKNTKVFEICPLEENQIVQFANHRLKNEEDVNDFLLKIKKTPYYDTSIRPLTMSHLCALYERYKTIPSKPKAIYKKIINLLLEKWDLDRGINRKSSFPGFDLDKKYELISFLAYDLTIRHQNSVFSYHIMQESYLNASREINLPNVKAKYVLNELELHSGLIVQNSYETFEFAHKSLQEFLCADYLVKLPPHKLDVLSLLKIPNELAIAISISPGYFQYVVLNLFTKTSLNENFITIFLNRLLLEDPEFKISIELGIAFFHLFSHSYFNFTIHKNDNIYNLFKSLFNKQIIESSTGLLRLNYQIDKRGIINTSDGFIQLSQFKSLSLKENLYIPDSFIINEEFFKHE